MTELQPLRLSADMTFDDSADVLVIGLGAAGASAAIEARGAGAEVLVLERASAGGGSTQYSGGFLYLGGGTRPQRLNGFEDSADNMYRFLSAATPHPDHRKIRDYCEGSVAHFDWLEAQGLRFDDGYYPHKHFEHPTEDSLAWSGNEKVWPYSEVATPVPRGHLVTRPGRTGQLGEGGLLLATTLIARVKALGARIEPDSRVQQLIVDEAGRVVGAQYRRFGEIKRARAQRGVVLATGGFGANAEMVQQYCPVLTEAGSNVVGAPTADGDGIRLGASVGGTPINMEGCLITSPFYPPESLFKGILVNKEGRRFVAEDSYHGRSAWACLQQPDRIAYLICDNAVFGRPEFQAQPLIDAWETVAEMEHDLGIPAGALQAELAAYNADAAETRDPAFHKYQDWLQPLTEAPFAALDCSLGKAFYSGFTLGGLRTSAAAEVLDTHGTPIPGLFAAGACASNIAQDSAGYASGTCLGESTFFGRRAGLGAAHGPG